jgi:hypothetical protein
VNIGNFTREAFIRRIELALVGISGIAFKLLGPTDGLQGYSNESESDSEASDSE